MKSTVRLWGDYISRAWFLASLNYDSSWLRFFIFFLRQFGSISQPGLQLAALLAPIVSARVTGMCPHTPLKLFYRDLHRQVWGKTRSRTKVWLAREPSSVGVGSCVKGDF